MSSFYKFIKIFLIITLVVVSVLGIHKSLAADQIVDVSFPCPTGSCEPPADLPSYINTIYQFALGISGLLALGMIVAGGVYYTVSAGNSSRQGDAKSMITSAIWGLVLLFGSYLILNTINPQITKMGLDFSKATPTIPSNQTEALIEPLKNDCGDFNKIGVYSGEVVRSGLSCAVRRGIVKEAFSVGTNKFTNGEIYYDESEDVPAGSLVWLYPYFITKIGPPSAVCLVYAYRDNSKNNPANEGKTTLIDLNPALSYCASKQQINYIHCGEWTMTADATNDVVIPRCIPGISCPTMTPVNAILQVNNSFNYPDLNNSPPVDDKTCPNNINFKSCWNKKWTCTKPLE